MHRRRLDYIKKLNFADIDSVEKLKKTLNVSDKELNNAITLNTRKGYIKKRLYYSAIDNDNKVVILPEGWWNAGQEKAAAYRRTI